MEGLGESKNAVVLFEWSSGFFLEPACLGLHPPLQKRMSQLPVDYIPIHDASGGAVDPPSMHHMHHVALR